MTPAQKTYYDTQRNLRDSLILVVAQLKEARAPRWAAIAELRRVTHTMLVMEIKL